jgi:IPT/TIG domain
MALTTSASPGPHAVEAASVVPGLSLGGNDAMYGDDQLIVPPDAQLAASPAQTVEVAGATMAILSSDGSVQWSIDLHALFQLFPTSDFGAPSLTYDYSSSRWFLGGTSADYQYRSARLFLAVSKTANPFGSWSIYVTGSRDDIPHCLYPTGATCPNYDYFVRESIAVTTDNVVQAFQVADLQDGIARSGAFNVLSKTQLFAGGRVQIDQFSLGQGGETDFAAVQMQSNFYVAYLVWLKAPGATSAPDRLGLLQVTGQPGNFLIPGDFGSTTVWEKDFTMTPPVPFSNQFPNEPGGSLNATGAPLGAPITSAVYRGGSTYGQGQVVLAINDNCSTNTCIRLMKVSNFGNATVVAQDNQVSPPYPYSLPLNAPDLDSKIPLAGADLFDASLAIDPYGNLFMTAAFSSSTRNPGFVLGGIVSPVTGTSPVLPISPIVEGPSNVDCQSNLWGSFLRSVPDPNNWNQVLMPGEVSLGGCDWATGIARATMGHAPQFTGISQTYGSTKGGQQVEIDGGYFVPGAEQVLFGTTPGTIQAEAPWAILVTAPAGAPGTVPITVQTPDGTIAAGNFTFVDYGARQPPAAAPSVSPRSR